MPYTPTTWVNGTTPVNQTNMNNLETQYAEASNTYTPELFTPFVYSGFTATKDGTTPTQLDVTAGVAFLLQTDGTLRKRAVSSSTQTTATPSSTYHLYLQPDGTWYWSTSNSPASNSLAICTVTTDASGNIATVTDARVTGTTLLAGAAGSLTLPNSLTLGGNLTTNGGWVYGPNSSSIQLGANAAGDIHLNSGTSGWVYYGNLAGSLRGDGSLYAGGAGIYDNGSRVAVIGAHSAGQTIISYGSGQPATLAVNEIFIQVS
jgi:hypothetical protein